MFWTVRIPDRAVTTSADLGTASYRLANVPLRDYPNFWFSLVGEPSSPGVASFVVTFRAQGPRKHYVDKANHFTMDYRVATATISWRAHSGSFSFASDPKSSKTIVALIANEQNGVFSP